MIRKIGYICALIMAALIGSAIAQTINTSGRITNSVYVLESGSDENPGTLERTARIYQLVNFNADMSDISFHFSGRALTDLQNSLPNDDRFKAWRLSLKAKNLLNKTVDVELGRQFIHAGIPFGSLDGLVVSARPFSSISTKVYGGVESQLFRSFKMYNADQATIGGGEVSWKSDYQTDVQVAYLQRVRESNIQWQIAAINVANRSLNGLNMFLQAHYDLQNERFHRLDLSGRYAANKAWAVHFGVRQQYPQIYGDSYFTIFNIKQYRKLRLGLDTAVMEGLRAGLNYRFLDLDEGQGHQVSATLFNADGAIEFIYETGDLGEQSGLILDYAYDLMQNLTVSASVDYSRYRFEEIYEYDNQLANAVRVSYFYNKNLRTDIEYQWLSDRFKDSDQRFLNHIHFVW